jgi:hypothetical protein
VVVAEAIVESAMRLIVIEVLDQMEHTLHSSLDSSSAYKTPHSHSTPRHPHVGSQKGSVVAPSRLIDDMPMIGRAKVSRVDLLIDSQITTIPM